MKQVPQCGPTIPESVNLSITRHYLLSACELIHILVCNEAKTAVTVVKMLGTTVQNVVVWPTRCLRLIHP